MSNPTRTILSAPTGAPLEPSGNPMLSGMGPAAYAQRSDKPDTTVHGEARIVPLRAAPGFFLNPEDPDPRGMSVIAADGLVAGTITEVWVDRAEAQPRYYEVAITGDGRVLLPATNVRIKARRGEVNVKSITASQFADVPKTKHPDLVTLREEDMIQAYYASGYLYALPGRMGPVL
ncbi:MAG: photosynthetic reaction center subunit H [Gemmatimonadota bacterium]